MGKNGTAGQVFKIGSRMKLNLSESSPGSIRGFRAVEAVARKLVRVQDRQSGILKEIAAFAVPVGGLPRPTRAS